MFNISSKATTTKTAILPSDEDNETFQAYHISLILFSVLIILSNIFAITIYCRNKTIRKNLSNVLLCSLAISDLLTGILYLPMLVVIERGVNKYSWLITLQRFHFMFGNWCGFSTVFHIIALTVDKYLAVLHPFKKITIASRSFYRKLLLLIWTAALIFALVPVCWYFKDERSKSWFKKFKIYGIVQLVIFFGLSLVILIYCYLRMFTIIHHQETGDALTGKIQRRERTDRKTILVLACFFAVFVIGWFPWFLFTLDPQMFHVPLEIKDFLVTLRFAGAFLNPAIYAFLKNDYREAVISNMAKMCGRTVRKMDLIPLKTTNHTLQVFRSEECQLEAN